MCQLPMNEVPDLLKLTDDTFIDMKKWGKGIIFINGINIGRYWQVGPQQTLYIPGVWLKKVKIKLLFLSNRMRSQEQK